MKKYILLAELSLLATLNAQEQLTPSLTTLRYSLDDLATQLTTQKDVKRPKPTQAIEVAAIRRVGDIQDRMRQLANASFQQKKEWARGIMNALQTFVNKSPVAGQDIITIQGHLKTILNADLSLITAALNILQQINAPKDIMYATILEPFEIRITSLEKADDRQKKTAGFRNDLAAAREYPNVLTPFIQEARDSHADEFTNQWDALQDRLIALQTRPQ